MIPRGKVEDNVSRPGGFFRWRWRLGRFDNAAQVANWIHVRYGRTPGEAWALVERIQRDHEGKDTDPQLIWREAREHLRTGRGQG